MKYKKSIKILKQILKENGNLTKEEWDKYAQENQLYSTTTLMAHTDTFNWEELKKSI